MPFPVLKKKLRGGAKCWLISFNLPKVLAAIFFTQYSIIVYILVVLMISMPSPQVMDYDGISKNVTDVGFCETGKWMYTGGEDGTARIWDLRYADNEI